jgi:hypothetical protein
LRFPNRTAALNQLNEAARAEIQPLLSEQQAAILGHAGLKEMKFVTAKFHPPGFAVSLGKQ